MAGVILLLVSPFAGFMQALRGETAAANSRGHSGISDLLLLAGNSTLLNDQSKLFTPCLEQRLSPMWEPC